MTDPIIQLCNQILSEGYSAFHQFDIQTGSGPVVHRHHEIAIGPDHTDKVDILDHGVMLARPVMTDRLVF
ncbi:MAG: hypothetical protein DWI24_06085 [Planctomycetota bacterium]|nr:MAG: hypothetical protein DWI24_06085 [Planctomycetota bacterium]